MMIVPDSVTGKLVDNESLDIPRSYSSTYLAIKDALAEDVEKTAN